MIPVQAGSLNVSKVAKKYHILAVAQGCVRVYLLAEDGKEITLCRMTQGSFCEYIPETFSVEAPQYEVLCQAEPNTALFCIPAHLHRCLMNASVPYLKCQMHLQRRCFSRVIALLNEMLSRRLESRVASFLLEESRLQGTAHLKITHEMIARHLGSAREVITRVLKDLQKSGALALHRGSIQLTDIKKLQEIL